VQGLIQIAAGLHKLAGQQPGPCATLLRKGLAKLHGAPLVLDGIDVAAARVGAERVLAALAEGRVPPAKPIPI
jgi:hypothetical protein